MNIIIDHIPFSTPFNRRPNIKMIPNTITIHSTANLKSTAKNERGWLENPSNKRQASWHYVVDDKDIIEAIPPNYVAWHATDGRGDGNMKSISVEMCESGNRELVIKRTQELVKYLMKKHNIQKVVRHYDWYKNKTCPRILNNDGKWTEWFNFLDGLKNGEDDTLNLENYQWDMLVEKLKKCKDDGEFSSEQWIDKATKRTLTVSELVWLHFIIDDKI
ncbi:peptidoglycan recognition family protein [Schinkia azotoformans]|uniref:peptidoglycan recognition protein family protein n=1 Tax=Schinkia azotoformans TaxID=1454 RepID=UPI002DBD22F8|nr:peptidoglycan recognition family protein [Schinkia azotoformans]MEC1778390.1 peptidoglycan recognition family protein [Schinkia azotoformans]MED4328365.1 peptidoglycan recognition family protein [Schinkia azotoformans]